ncbi:MULTISPECIES: hypothetical protein [Empedobacter]|jgi:hypothetical protein|uniref:hypothetical protein n=1 Tax=Empedobacter TaxID=59734 RepID=UPI0015DE2A59|nr:MULTISPECIES: hypothetical protein [Empedobacter]MDH2207951.1 hypothetical protein [Empedobacter sp. GD03644]
MKLRKSSKITKSFFSEYNAETNLKRKIISDKIIWNYDTKYKTSQKEATTKDIHVEL